MQELICILCPKGCHLKVYEEDDYRVTGNACPKGLVYGREELLQPVRVVTSTVRVASKTRPRCSVKTSQAVPKAAIGEVMRLLDEVELKPPVHVGDVVLANILDSPVAIVATRNIDA